MVIRTLLIDNYDSYTYNLYQLIAQVNGVPPTVVYNDQIDLETVLKQLEQGIYHNIVISPGPGTPAVPGDVGLCLSLIKAAPNVPILGVCLGFQALALAHGARVSRAPEPVHGRLNAISHSGSHPLFKNIPSGEDYQVVRYHSLVVEESSLPPELEPIAWTAKNSHHHALGVAAAMSPNGGPSSLNSNKKGGGVLMAIAHINLPYYGVQYHPESIGTAYGTELLKNFRDLTLQHFCGSLHESHYVGNGGDSMSGGESIETSTDSGTPKTSPSSSFEQQHATILKLSYRCLPAVLGTIAGGSQTLFEKVILQQNAGCAVNEVEDTFWLDSSTPDRGRFSFMGGKGGPLWRRITYKLDKSSSDVVTTIQLYGTRTPQNSSKPGTLVSVDGSGVVESVTTFFWDWLDAELHRWHCAAPAAEKNLPFSFWGGLIGYLGYELKAECGGNAARHALTPDAAFFLTDQFLAIDHETHAVYAVAMHEESAAETAQQWLDTTVALVEKLSATEHANGNGAVQPSMMQSKKRPMPFTLREPRSQYLINVGSCMDALYSGDSYELCLTTELRRNCAQWSSNDAFGLYKILRRVNPAPYAAWMNFKDTHTKADSAPLSICCSSPERFLRGDLSGGLEAKPIKGTAPRKLSDGSEADAAAAAALAASEKDRAENLMIVDLLRNDLGRVCDPGSVHVPALMHIESFATVHQLVSTVRGQRKSTSSVADAVKAAFPGGSMTGAPKVRSMAILDALESGPRGIYSGSLGYLSFNGAFDLNIVIRTAIVHDNDITIGAGGAIVVQSDADGEYDEMRLKAAALMKAIAECDGVPGVEAAEVLDE